MRTLSLSRSIDSGHSMAMKNETVFFSIFADSGLSSIRWNSYQKNILHIRPDRPSDGSKNIFHLFSVGSVRANWIGGLWIWVEELARIASMIFLSILTQTQPQTTHIRTWQTTRLETFYEKTCWFIDTKTDENGKREKKHTNCTRFDGTKTTFFSLRCRFFGCISFSLSRNNNKIIIICRHRNGELRRKNWRCILDRMCLVHALRRQLYLLEISHTIFVGRQFDPSAFEPFRCVCVCASTRRTVCRLPIANYTSDITQPIKRL